MTTQNAGTVLPPLFVLEMANNHMGSVAHGLRIIREGTPYGFWRPQVERLEAGDIIMEIIPTVG